MQKRIRGSALRALKTAGVFDRVRDSRWRRRKLLILCYHCFAIEQENQWRPALFLTSERLRARFEILKRGGYNVLPLSEGLERLRRNELPERSIVLTFDDGTYDFYKMAYPLLKEYEFPATVYQTTYYCSRRMPVFSLICSYMLWKKRDTALPDLSSIGVSKDAGIGSHEARESVLAQLFAFAEREKLTTEQKNELAGRLAEQLGINYGELLQKRVLQLMMPEEIAEAARGGIRFELHTHRHRMPRDRELFAKEINDNRNALQAMTGSQATHFCYPSGDYESMFFPWLRELGVESATTCDPGIVSARSQAMTLPRFIDTTGQTELEFEGWLAGVGALLAAGADTLLLRNRS
jgi:peptidoglycan/xylan/chitin deacetylase (PgdA/CDA1 family)